MTDLEKAQQFFADDKYAAETTGIVITEVGELSARVELDLDERHYNALGAVMGGVYFTMCDFAFAVASNHNSVPCVTLGSHAIFVEKNKSNHLICEARCIKNGRHTCFYEVDVTDDLGTEIAHVTVEGYKLLGK